jgi:hypothetical protein
MLREPVDSSAISSVGFDAAAQILEVEFRRGRRVFRFLDVPEFMFKGLMLARSKGRFVATRIADRYRSEQVS